MYLEKEQLIKIEGGLNITGTLVNSISRGVNVVLELGRSFGSALRRIYANKICPL